jgi:acyl-CoA reductase-like NAD-dependent aldehyde dehydrogenase
MVFEKEQDWKELLAKDAQQILAELLERAKDHKGAYMQAEDVKVAQLWSALVEIKKDIDSLKQVIETLSTPFKAIVEVGEAEKKKAIERIIRDIVKPAAPEEEEATKKLVESLMKF